MDRLVPLPPEAAGVGDGASQVRGIEDPAEATVQGEGGEIEAAGGLPVVLVARHSQVGSKVRLFWAGEAS